uniref:Chlororespiratory reduction 41 n=1 Tax=Cypripedium formosanum TaxID=53042 RepID=A0A0F7J2C4_9ASPA|nr:chlororespiratory reduction 41 [Cypripedium formosanum]
MASSLRFLPAPIPHPIHLSRSLNPTITRCSTSDSTTPSIGDPSAADPLATPVVLELRRKAALLREGRGSAVAQPDPPNFEIGWKRTKEIKNEKPKGWAIADVIDKLEGLMGRQYGSAELLAKVGSIVAERARVEAEVLLAGGEVDDRMITEFYRLLKLIEMDLEMVKAAVKEETLAERIEKARARCRQAIRVALSF